MKLSEKLKNDFEQNEKFRLLACVLSGIFSSVPYFVSELFLLEWIAFVPFICVLLSDRKITLRRAFLYGFINHFSKSVIVFTWFKELYSMSALDMSPVIMILVIAAAIIGLSALQAIPYGVATLILSSLKKIEFKLPLLAFSVTAPILFTGCEMINTIIEQLPIGIIGFPWVLTYVTQGSFTYGIQTSSVFGAHFISFIVYLSNVLIALMILKCRKVQKICVILLISLFTANIGYGIISVKDENGTVKALAYQDNNSSYSKWTSSSTENCDTFISDMESAYTKEDMPQLIVLSETVFPVKINSGVSGSYIKKVLCDFTKKYGNTVVIGGFLYEGDMRYNAQFTFENGRLCDTVYKKRTLVPFGEYIPFENVINAVFPFMSEFNLSGNSLDPGTSTDVVECNFAKLGGLICYDSIFWYNARESAENNCEIIVVSTNDSWYNDSAAAYQHYTHSVFRAIETGKPVVRSATTGISGIIDRYGRTLDKTKLLVKGYAEAEIAPSKATTPFVIYGYGWFYILLFADVLFIAISAIKRRKLNEA